MGLFSNIFGPTEDSDNKKPPETADSKTDAHRNQKACPHCGFILDPPPKRKKKCEECGNYIYVRKTQEIFNSDLLSEDQALAADFFNDLAQYGARPSDYSDMSEKLKSKWGFEPNPYDVVWSLSIQLLTQGPDLRGVYDPKSELLQYAKMITFAQALYQAKRGKDPTSFKKSVANYEIDINTVKDIGITKMEILSNGCCDECDKLNGKIYEIEGLKEKEILPVEGCTNKLSKEDKYSWCVCIFLPVIE